MKAMTAFRETRAARLPRLLGIASACLLVATSVTGCWFDSRPALEFTPTTLADAQAGQPYAVTITVTKASTPVGNAGIADGALPDGLTLVFEVNPANSMTISGTPTTAGTYSFTVSVWCLGTNVSGQTGQQAYTLVVK
jgi:large repetitive protein